MSTIGRHSRKKTEKIRGATTQFGRLRLRGAGGGARGPPAGVSKPLTSGALVAQTQPQTAPKRKGRCIPVRPTQAVGCHCDPLPSRRQEKGLGHIFPLRKGQLAHTAPSWRACCGSDALGAPADGRGPQHGVFLSMGPCSSGCTGLGFLQDGGPGHPKCRAGRGLPERTQVEHRFRPARSLPRRPR